MSSLSSFRSMEFTAVRCLINSISRFILLVKCSTFKAMPTEDQEMYRYLASYLQHLKALLDNISGCKTSLDVILSKECEELDIYVNEVREFLEEWSPKMSRILCVLQIEPLVLKIHKSTLKISEILSGFSGSLASSLENLFITQRKDVGIVSRYVEEALERQREGKSLCAGHLIPIIESFKLTSNPCLLNEFIYLEKERTEAESNKQKELWDNLEHIIDLLSHIRDFMIELETYKFMNGTKVPPFFRCPLSLELMLDPVIVASGRTYEKASIQKWLDHGLNTCPKTHQKLAHIDLTPNHAVKDLILNWSKENNIQLLNSPSCQPDSLSRNSWSEDVNSGNHLQYVPPNQNSLSGSCAKSGDDSRKMLDASFGLCDEDFNVHRIREAVKFDHSPTHSYVHSRSESASTVVSSNDYFPSVLSEISPAASNQDHDIDTLRGLPSDCPTTDSYQKHSYDSPLTERKYHSSKPMAEITGNGRCTPCRVLSFPSDGTFNDLTTASDVEKLIKNLRSQSIEQQTAAAAELRFLSKHNMENRVIIGNCGAIAPLIQLLHSDVKQIQEEAVTALLNLSISDAVKVLIAEGGPLEPLIYVLRTGSGQAKANAAACLSSLSLLEDYKVKIGRSEAVKALVELLGSGTVRGRKDAATALFNLSIFHENKARIVQAGAVKYLVELLDPAREMVDKAVALLANLSTLAEGSSAIVREGSIPSVVEIVEMGSQRGKENAASTLLQLCINNPNYSRLILQEGAVPPLVALSQSGTPRGKEKAQQLLSLFRTQREGVSGRRKP